MNFPPLTLLGIKPLTYRYELGVECFNYFATKGISNVVQGVLIANFREPILIK